MATLEPSDSDPPSRWLPKLTRLTLSLHTRARVRADARDGPGRASSSSIPGEAHGRGRVEVTGTVTLDGKLASDVQVMFIADGDTPGNGGSGRTDADGRYTLQNHQGDPGVAPGKYRVVLNRLLTPDGSPLSPDSNVGPMDSPARETLPPRYSAPDRTILRAIVPAQGGEPSNFTLTSGDSD